MFAYELKRMYPPMTINMIKKSIMIKLEFTKLLFCFVIRDIIQKTRLKMKRLIKFSLKIVFFKTNDENIYKKIVNSCVNTILRYESNEQHFEINTDNLDLNYITIYKKDSSYKYGCRLFIDKPE